MKLHGVIPVAVALDPGLAEPPMELRVTMDRHKKAGYYFVVSDDPAVAARKAYVRLESPELVEDRLWERCN